MKVFLLVMCSAALMLTAGSCKKESLSAPAVHVTVSSVSYPPSETNSYVQYTATVQLRKRGGTYSQEKAVTGTGACSFENLEPGDYWINETLTRHSEDITVRAGEVTEFTFVIP